MLGLRVSVRVKQGSLIVILNKLVFKGYIHVPIIA